MRVLLKFLRCLCAVYTVTSLVFLLLNMAIAGSVENTVIRPDAFLLMLPFAAGLALAGLVYSAHRISFALRLTAHFAVCTLSAFVFLYLPAGTGAGASMKFVMFLLTVLVYWIIMGPYLALTAKTRRNEGKTAQYQSVFKK